MTKVYSVLFATICGEIDSGIVKSFTTNEEAIKYKNMLTSESDRDTYFYVEESGLYNKIEDIDE